MAVTAVTGDAAWGVIYTFTTDSSADWGSVANNTYFYDKTDKVVYYKDSSGTVLSMFSASSNFATDDLTLTGARSHDLAGNKLILRGRDIINPNNRIEFYRGSSGGAIMTAYSDAAGDGIIAAMNYNGATGGYINGFYAQTTLLVGQQIRIERTGTTNSRIRVERGGYGYAQFGDNYDNFLVNDLIVGSNGTASARLHVIGKGATSATTTFLVENNAGTDSFKVFDDGKIAIGKTTATNPIDIEANVTNGIGVLRLVNSSTSTNAGSGINLQSPSGVYSGFITVAQNTMTSSNFSLNQALSIQAQSGTDLNFTLLSHTNSFSFFSNGTAEADRILELHADSANAITYLDFGSTNSTTSYYNQSRIQSQLTTTTALSEDSKMIFQTSDGGTLVTNLTLEENKVGFYTATPVVQPSGTGETVGFTAGTGTGVNDDSTFTGNLGTTAYNLNDVVKALKQIGILAQ